MTIKSEDLDISSLDVSSKKMSKKVCNKDLPKEYTKNGAWGILIKTLIRYIATTSKVFNISDKVLINALEVLCDHFYSDTGIEMVITPTSVPFRLVSPLFFSRRM